MGRARGLARLARLYAMVENLDAMQVKSRASAVFEVERAEEAMAASQARSVAEGRAGLERGSRMESLAAEQGALREAARAGLLARLRAERRVLLEAAVEAHRESRKESRQVDRLVEQVRADEEAERERRAQREADDRFLSRREWRRGRV